MLILESTRYHLSFRILRMDIHLLFAEKLPQTSKQLFPLNWIEDAIDYNGNRLFSIAHIISLYMHQYVLPQIFYYVLKADFMFIQGSSYQLSAFILRF